MVIVLGRRNWDYPNFFGPTADSLLSPPARPNIFNDKSVTDIFYDIPTLLILRHILARGTKLPKMPVGSIFPTHIIYVGFYIISWNDIPFELIFTAYPAFEVPEKVGAVYIFVYVSISKGGAGGWKFKGDFILSNSAYRMCHLLGPIGGSQPSCYRFHEKPGFRHSRCLSYRRAIL